ncbi:MULTISPECIES: ABC transporter ATP-binding protein [Campylobacter]|uniref:Lipid asymmetry ABC transporter MlaABCDEF, ATPase component MlaF n=1 Tax=Campylobacter fetus subsp. venerealis NCTC 10354 TaxID=983328 RepID=A0AAE6MA50_CAMFE|nr:lipid asymmetry ABC transporter MlaABCDEF, ATPase component MlaF [Campylobacter fetus subsp. venerealis 97/608]EAH8300803.1 ATP-binding cassette domain-containing protein [Campylobacter fetus]EGU23625.1 ABC transporter, ATP-binding protein [Campylobacter fetus subsp. venerealis NCTC 10354]PHJ03332.1 sulfate ABC transporter ATP-binding protein [Campylobacter fetus subsp. venerealis]TXF07672.1 ATP-binding cassette domain-containing protein [Campylobacter fetus subsp. fetus]CDF64468.1 Methioni
MIKAIDLCTAYGERIMHDHVSFQINDGEIYGLLGGSGSGKTTLLKTLIYLKEPTSGDIFWDNQNLWQANLQTRDELRLKMGVMFQFGALYSGMNVLDNIGILLKEYSDYDEQDINEIAKMWLIKVGLSKEAMSLYPSELSGGMKKRVALARSLALSPKVLFLDEPNSGLDPMSARALDKLICTIRDSLGITVVMVTHDIDSIFGILDRFLIIDNHKIAYEGDLKGALEYKENPLRELFTMRSLNGK